MGRQGLEKKKTKPQQTKPNNNPSSFPKETPNNQPNQNTLVLQRVTKTSAFAYFLFFFFPYIVALYFLISGFYTKPIYTQMYKRMMLLCVECVLT